MIFVLLKFVNGDLFSKKRCFAPTDKRPSAKDLLTHPFFR